MDNKPSGWIVARDRRRKGIGQAGVPLASDVIVRSLDGTVLRVEPAQQMVNAPRQTAQPSPLETLPAADRDDRSAVTFTPNGARRYDIHPALDYGGARRDLPGCTGGTTCWRCRGGQAGVCYNLMRLAEDIGVRPGTTQQWSSRGGVDWETADRVAVALGTLPYMIWPEWLDESLESADAFDNDPAERKKDAARRRERGMGPSPENLRAQAQKRRRDREAARKRALYATDPDYRERQKAASAARYAAGKQAARVTRRLYRERNAEKLKEQSAKYRARTRDRRKEYDDARRSDPDVQERRRLESKARYRINRDEMLAKQRARDRAKAAAKRAAKAAQMNDEGE